MKKTMVTVATGALVGLGSLFISPAVFADNTPNDRSEIKVKLSETNSEIKTVLADLQTLNNKIAKVDKALKENESAMNKTKDEITKTESEIEVLEDEIVELENNIETRFEVLKERMIAYQQNGGDIAYLEVLFGSKNFSEFISRVSAVTTIANADKVLIEEQEADKSKVEENKIEVETKLSEQEEMKVELEGMQALIEDQKKEHEADKSELKTKQDKLNSIKSELQLKDSQLAALEAEVVTTNASQSGSGSGANATATASSGSGKKASSSGNVPAPKPAAGGGSAISAGYSVAGTPYVWGGKSPGGFDCSGFVSWAYGQAGKSLPSSTAALSGVGTKISYSQIQPGDLVFFNTYKTNGHVGIYVGGGSFIGAQNSTGVAVANMSSGYWKSKFNGHVRRVN